MELKKGDWVLLNSDEFYYESPMIRRFGKTIIEKLKGMVVEVVYVIEEPRYKGFKVNFGGIEVLFSIEDVFCKVKDVDKIYPPIEKGNFFVVCEKRDYHSDFQEGIVCHVKDLEIWDSYSIEEGIPTYTLPYKQALDWNVEKRK